MGEDIDYAHSNELAIYAILGVLEITLLLRIDTHHVMILSIMRRQ